MKGKKLSILLFFSILVIAAVIRLWKFGTVPGGLDWDEASLGYNAFSILHTGRDEYGKWLPVILQSFGDYKPALYAYLIIPFLSFMGLTVQAVRMPSALAGIATIVLTYFLVKKLFGSGKMGLLAMLLLTLSPWHIQFSRIGFEANVGLFFDVAMATFFLYGLKKPWLLILSAVSFALSIYTYQSEKVFAPLLALTLMGIWWKDIWKLPKRMIVIIVAVALVVLLPMLHFMITDRNAFARAAGVSVFSQANGFLVQSSQKIVVDHQFNDKIGSLLDNRRVLLAKTVLSNYLVHFDPNWLFITGVNARHRAPNMGLVYLWELLFILLGIYGLLFSKLDRKYKQLIFFWFLLAPVPAAVTTGVPHEVRVIHFLPMLQIFTAYGVMQGYTFIRNQRNIFQYILFGIAALVITLNLAYYFDQYFVQQNYYTARDWRYGYQQAVQQVAKLQGGYNKVVISNKDLMDQSYIFFLFYLRYPPEKYQQAVAKGMEVGDDHAFGKYQFRFVDPTMYNCDIHTLVVGHYDGFTQPLPAQYIVHYPDGTPGIEILGKNLLLCKKPTLPL